MRKYSIIIGVVCSLMLGDNSNVVNDLNFCGSASLVSIIFTDLKC